MKTHFSFAKMRVALMACCALMAVVFTGCKQEDPFKDQGDVPDPHWTVPAENDMTASMTAVVRVTIGESAGTLAAFMDDACCGVADCVEGLYFLYICPTAPEGQITLRFYSPDLKRIFVTRDCFAFSNDENIGSVSAPFTCKWAEEKK